MDKISELKAQIEKAEKEIKNIYWKTQIKGIYDRGLKGIGGFWKFRNGYSDKHIAWYIYAEVVGCIKDDNSVYAILNTFEERPDGEIIIKVKDRDLNATNWMHCWDSIRKEDFLENKKRILKRAKIK